MRAKIKKIIKKLPENITLTGFAILYFLAEGGIAALEGIIESNHKGLAYSWRKAQSAQNIWNYHEVLHETKASSAKTILAQLKKKGLVSREGRVTNKGNRLVKVAERAIQQGAIWDGKWRIVFFDIPETRKAARAWLGYQLAQWNYSPLQKSVFMGKFPLDESIMKEIIERNLYSCVRIITVGEIDDETWLK